MALISRVNSRQPTRAKPKIEKKYNHCKNLRHNEKECWKKHPEKLPSHLQRRNKKQAKPEEESTLISLENAKSNSETIFASFD